VRELVELIARSLVDNPDAVQVNEIAGEQSVIIELKVAPDDLAINSTNSRTVNAPPIIQ
jgi:predicted RNA-binding protein YlqC (UPF0109 family)